MVVEVERAMLWLASVLGLVAVGSAVLVDNETPDGDETSSGPGPEADTGGDGLDAGYIEPDGSTVTGTDDNDIIAGTGAADSLDGGDGDDQLGGYSGHDWIGGGQGNDVLHGDSGDDSLSGGAGQDLLHGEDGADVLQGGAGEDSLFGHFGDDTLQGGGGADLLHGGQGEDWLEGGQGQDTLHGNDSDDSLAGGGGRDVLYGGYGNDVVSGAGDGADQDYVNGGTGDDTLIAGAGDVLTGGDGDDQFMAGHWTGTEDAVHLMDFDSNEDKLVLVWDFEGDEPSVELRQSPGAEDEQLILVDGEPALRVTGAKGMTAADLVLIDPASAVATGLLPQ
ncbi:calcium-binding protein [Leisingera methylohalidivorans]|nr:calcium-binding protein [Leisingera methylohalidivorans]